MKKREAPIWTKDLPFQIKATDDAKGTFEGLLSAYGVVDLVGDVVEKGAFSKTIAESGGSVPLLWQHDHKMPIGTLELEDREDGLWVKGELLIDEVQQAREAYALVKRNVIRGLSIGFRVVRQKMEDGIRKLKEISLKEGSIVTFPALPVAQIVSVKEQGKADFATELERVQLLSLRSQMFDALWRSVDDAYFDVLMGSLDSDAAVSAVDESIQQFHGAFMEFFPKLLRLFEEKQVESTEEFAGFSPNEQEKLLIKGAIARLTALLGSDADDTSESDADDTSAKEAAVTSDEEAAVTSEDRGLESRKALAERLKAVLAA